MVTWLRASAGLTWLWWTLPFLASLQWPLVSHVGATEQCLVTSEGIVLTTTTVPTATVQVEDLCVLGGGWWE